ncbi:MAG: hypothetical protein IJW64_05550 [Clostridia bacterium]|nr:hypothetical protein [Clostridia bacterium]
MEKKDCIKFLETRLKKYGATVYNYRGVEFLAIQNPNSENHMAFSFGDEEFTMEFTFQSARFKYGNEEDCAIHAEKYLNEELCSVEIFLSGKPLFGGSRETSKANFKTAEEFALFYACDNEQIANNLLGFMKNGNVSVKIFSWKGTFDRAFEISVDGNSLSIK